MSDAGRKGLGEKVAEAVTPDSTKSQQQKTKEGITDIGDKAVGGVQPDHSKSTTQEITDKAGHNKDTTHDGGSTGSVMDSAKHALGMDKH